MAKKDQKEQHYLGEMEFRNIQLCLINIESCLKLLSPLRQKHPGMQTIFAGQNHLNLAQDFLRKETRRWKVET